MVLGLTQLFYGLLTILYLRAVRRDYPLLAGRSLYDRLANRISARGAVWLLRGISFGLLTAGLWQLLRVWTA
jgi:hypothetical protein